MKLNNNKNIITDKDITITENKKLGDNLSEILVNQQNDINKLKSNIKWIYKYGGVGSGSGGGGINKWSVNATLDGQKILDNNMITLDPDKSIYELVIKTSGGNGNYHVVYTYNGISFEDNLTPEKNWKITIPIELLKNGTISVDVSDGSNNRTVSAQYIVQPYVFDNILLYEGDKETIYPSVTNDILIQDASAKGLILGCNYTIAVTAEKYYQWTFNNKPLDKVKFNNNTGKITYEVPRELISEENSGLYTAKLTIFLTPEGDVERTFAKNVEFNLVPNDLYLKIAPENSGEMIYDEIPSGEFYQYAANQTIGFKCKVYQGSNKNRPCTIAYKTEEVMNPGGERHSYELKGEEWVPYILKVTFKNEGWHKITFSCSLGGNPYETTKYLYCYKINTDYKWYNFKDELSQNLVSSRAILVHHDYYRAGQIDGNIPGFNKNFENTASVDLKKVFKFNLEGADVSNESQDVNINIGIQYNNINDDRNKIMSFHFGTAEAITIYQNKVEIRSPFVSGKTEQKIFIKKEKDYKPDDNDKFHLLTINIAKVRFDKQNGRYLYQVNFYIDGIIESSIQDFATGSGFLTEVQMHPGNYVINNLEVAYFVGSQIAAINDIDVDYYYYTYKSYLNPKFSEENSKLAPMLQLFYDLSNQSATYNIENQLIKVRSTLCNDLANNLNVPTLVLERSKKLSFSETELNVVDWLNGSYDDESKVPQKDWKVPVTPWWSAGGMRPARITAGTDLDKKMQFYIKLQGSSTLRFKSKNLTLGVEPIESGVGTILFSPNYDPIDNSTFLPEQSFTLKADVVDSSHTNNTAMGKFINANNNFEYDLHQTGENIGQLKQHVKQCLEGFPILLYLRLTDDEDVANDETYYLGVYNFNLGRDSYYNLGYCALSDLKNLQKTDPQSFSFTVVDKVDPMSNFVAAEVQDNSKYWDFSQYDPTILFKNENYGENANFMFGDIVKNSGNVEYKNSIQTFVQKVANAGGYLFGQIHKKFEPVGTEKESNEVAYHKKDVVPDYRTQYTRDNNQYTVKPELGPEAKIEDLSSCIKYQVTEEDPEPYLNYDSAAYYYTTCMAFGLVDSVQKNLNIKTWDGRQFGLFFYDMDTCLGTSNSGNDTSYFCFSDYWESDIQKIEKEDGTIETINNGITLYRDYFPLKSKIVGYDIPSSYLLAIPKYAGILTTYNQYLLPQSIWAKWRKKDGVLRNADYFISEYYAKNLRNIPEFLLNLNYRNKYLYTTSGTSHATVCNILQGTKIEKTRNWLNGRFHILDAYFNLNADTIKIGDTIYAEPIFKTDGNLNENPDIFVLKDIFRLPGESVEPVNRTGPCKFKIKTEEYAPLIVKKGTALVRYLFDDSNTLYTVNEFFSGDLVSNFGGSDLWTHIENISPFVTSLTGGQIFNCFSQKIDKVFGNEGTITQTWNLDVPSVKKIELTSPNYAGNLTINDKFYNLNEIDISNSKISLNVNTSNVRTVNISNINSNEINFVNCHQLESVNLSNSIINNCRISPSWDKDAIFKSPRIKNLIISGKKSESDSSLGNLMITDSFAMKELNFEDFENIRINNCEHLFNVICSDSSPKLKTVTITDCPELRALTVYADNIQSLDLHGCSSLTTLTLKSKSGIFDKLKILNLENTKIKSINYIVNDHSQPTTSYLDLTPFTNLSINSRKSESYFKINGNSEVTAIRVTNIKEEITEFGDKIGCFYLHYPLTGCSKLERIYGNYMINTENCFNGLTRFSIHGSDLSKMKWHGSPTLDANGVVKMPYQILGKTPNEINSDLLFQDGELVTNLSFNITNASYAFARTNCTIFDYYYIFSNCSNLISCYGMFAYTYNANYGVFNWTSDKCDNSPNRFLFVKTPNIINIGECFRYDSRYASLAKSPQIRIYSYRWDAESLSNDGLFSPLKNLNSCMFPFFGYTYFVDKYIFRRIDDNYNNLESLTYFNPLLIFKNINTLKFDDIKLSFRNIIDAINDNFVNYGDISEFFNNTPKISSINGFLSNTSFINYDLINETGLRIPGTVTTLRSSFVSTFAKGEILFNEYFAKPSTLKHVWQSFRVLESHPKISGDRGYNAKFTLSNSTFELFTGIESLGYGGTGDFSSSDCMSSSFNGKGITKIIDGGKNDEFPYLIFNNNRNLVIASGIFMNANPIENHVFNDVKLPGNIFINNSRLKNCAALFYNMGIDYKLTPVNMNPSSDDDYNKEKGWCNFSKCTKLENVSYLFGEKIVNANKPRLSGMIPLNLFYHGYERINKTIEGANERTWDSEKSEWVYSDFKKIDISYNRPFNTIKDMRYCFKHCNCSEYRFPGSDLNQMFEPNPNYSPIKYIKDSNGRYKTNTEVDNNKNTIIWRYDGDKKPKNNGIYADLDGKPYEDLDIVNFDKTDETGNLEYNYKIVDIPDEGEGSATPTPYYFCPPDLLRYCINNANIEGLFDSSGVSGWSTTYNGTENKFNKYGYGIKGRICPYLLKPIPNTENINNIFRTCKGLSYYSDNKGKIDRMIPEGFFKYAPGIKNLELSFSDMIFPPKAYIDDIFTPLRNELNIHGIFMNTYWNNSTNPKNTIGYVFKDKYISDMTEAFLCTNNTQTDRVTAQNLVFNTVFDKRYGASSFETNSKYYRVFKGYNSNYTEFQNKTLVDNATTENYKFYNK